MLKPYYRKNQSRENSKTGTTNLNLSNNLTATEKQSTITIQYSVKSEFRTTSAAGIRK